jgi:hypothetical protein
MSRIRFLSGPPPGIFGDRPLCPRCGLRLVERASYRRINAGNAAAGFVSNGVRRRAATLIFRGELVYTHFVPSAGSSLWCVDRRRAAGHFTDVPVGSTFYQ